ncbi:snf7 family protein, partial [Paraphaeosphaeria sporulosa]
SSFAYQPKKRTFVPGAHLSSSPSSTRVDATGPFMTRHGARMRCKAWGTRRPLAKTCTCELARRHHRVYQGQASTLRTLTRQHRNAPSLDRCSHPPGTLCFSSFSRPLIQAFSNQPTARPPRTSQPLSNPAVHPRTHRCTRPKGTALHPRTCAPPCSYRAHTNMSGWGLGWFGGGGQKKEAPKKAILQLRGQLEMLNKREKHLQNQMDEQDTLARKHVNTNKTAAKAALRRKKQFEHSLEQTQSQIMTLEREVYSIETANINKETLDAMKNAGAAMKHIHAGLTIDKVDNVMEDLREQHAIGDEISEAITSGVATSAIDEDDLDEELAELQQEQLDEQMLNTGPVPVGDKVGRLPQAPNAEIKGKAPTRVEEDDEEEELRKLQAEMAM